MRRTRLTFLVLAAIGGCTPLAYDPRYGQDPSMQSAGSVARQYAAPPPQPPKWTRPEDPAPVERVVDSTQPALLTASAGPNGVTTSVTPAKQPVQVAQLPPQPPPLPNYGSSTAPRPAALAQVDQYLDKSKVNQASYTETKCDKPGFVERTDADLSRTNGLLPPTPLPAAVAGATNNVVDLGNAGMTQQPAFRMVNTKKFSLNFEVKDVGVTGISSVDLWCTQDMHTWKKFESVQQLANALLVEVKEEGTYGFTLLARNGNGLGKAPPQPGDLPQVWVSVDLTPPAVTLSGVEMSLTSKTPGLIIRWTAKDRNFGPRPVTLSYASNPEGPWTLMAANVDNTGRYEWPLTDSVPANMYVRVQAADLNGNVGYAQTENPIRLDGYTVKADTMPEPARPSSPPPASIDPARPSTTILSVDPSQQ
jgi:hypothetical protein